MNNRPNLDDDMWLLYCAGDEDDKRFAGTYFSIRFWIDLGIITVVILAIIRGLMWLRYPDLSVRQVLGRWFRLIRWSDLLNPKLILIIGGTIIFSLMLTGACFGVYYLFRELKRYFRY
ncbi:MAG: hypothetical protein IJM37_01855 [Lachnospiraceae bacterium]|nr:hypothetical protein [Lachnospiraceae bacterium]